LPSSMWDRNMTGISTAVNPDTTVRPSACSLRTDVAPPRSQRERAGSCAQGRRTRPRRAAGSAALRRRPRQPANAAFPACAEGILYGGHSSPESRRRGDVPRRRREGVWYLNRDLVEVIGRERRSLSGSVSRPRARAMRAMPSTGTKANRCVVWGPRWAEPPSRRAERLSSAPAEVDEEHSHHMSSGCVWRARALHARPNA